MADPKQKLVKVDDGIVAFPGDLPDEHVVNAIKLFRAKKKVAPLQTEESEHARQLKPAQPLDSAIPHLPQWANTPVLSGLTFDAQIQRAEKSGHPEQAEWLRKQKSLQDKAYQKNIDKHPIATGVGEGVGETAEGLTSPANLALMITAPESKIMSGLFAIQSLHGSYKDVEEAREGRNAEASKYATQAVLNLGIAGLAGHHAVKDIPVPEGVKDFVKSEEGSVGPQGKVAPAKPDSKTESEPGYAYHATNIDRLEDIANSGKLKIYGPSYGTDQSMWPDRSTSKRAYFTPKAGSAWQFAPEEGRPVIVRTKSAGLKKEGTGDLYSETPVGVQNLEYLGEDKQWHPVQKLAMPKAVPLADVKAKAAELKPTTAYKSADQSQPFYLKSENLINEKMKGPMPAEDVHKMLLSNGVKPEEMKWTGLDELLQGKGKQKVTPQEIQEHLAGNNLQIQEVTKGRTDNRAAIEDLDKKIEEINHKFSVSNKAERDALFSEREALSEQRRNLVTTDYKGQDTKFGSYVLPGAEKGSYRELLVTMPEKAAKVDLKKAADKAYEDKEWFQADIRRRTGRFLWETLAPEQQAEYRRLSDAYQQARDAYTSGGNENFRSSHWDEPNVLGHVRFNDRTGPNGEKILHVEELQSDWAQSGRKKGFQGEAPNTTGWKATKTEDHPESWTITDNQGHEISEGGRNLFYGKTQAEAIADAAHTVQTGAGRTSKVPPMPFSKTWPELLLKRMMKYASDNNYSGISWTPGEEQAARYDLSKQVDAIHYRSAGPRMFSVEAYRQGVGTVLSQTGTPEELEGVVGKDIVRKMVAKEGEEVGGPGDFRKLTGVDLKVGGEGMKGFYDKIIPDAANKLGKQWGAKVGETKLGEETSVNESSLKNDLDQKEKIYTELKRKLITLDTNPGTYSPEYLETQSSTLKAYEKYSEALDKYKEAKTRPSYTVPYLPITPQMRAGVKSIPYSLFTIPLAAGALTLAQVKEKAQELQDKQKKTGATQ